MNWRIAWLAISVVTLVASPARTQVLYEK